MNITKQQQEILFSIKKYKSIKINAFAGTGKTSTLKLISNEYKSKKILYLAFNSAIKNEASFIFPSNTYVKTTHGLAYSAIKKHTNLKLDNLNNYRAIDISKLYDISYNQAIISLKIFDAYCNSAKEKIQKNDTEHNVAKKMFNDMLINKLNPTHNFYLKYYQLLLVQEQIKQYPYDIIMLDEAQDTNEVTLSIFEHLKANTKICVGDIHQQIYSFRGSKNALDKIDFDKNLYLSCSFRFNKNIALFANNMLKNFKNETVNIDTIENKDDKVLSNAYISRTNATLISIIATRIENKKPFVTIRDPNEIFSLTIEVYYFLNNMKKDIKKNYFLKEFSNEEDLLDYINEVEDYELKLALKVAKEYGNKLFSFMDISLKFYKAWKNKNNTSFHKRVNEILFLSTVHTSKGLEWDSVTIADDFIDFADIILDLGYETLEDFQENYKSSSANDLLDEFNLFYVAITRSKKKIIKDSENFHYLLSNNISKLINTRIKESKNNIKSINKNIKATKLQKEDKSKLLITRNKKDNKLKNQGLKWSLSDKIKVKSLYKKNISILELSNKFQRTTSAILGELYKSEVINKAEQNKLSALIKNNIYNTNKSML